MDVTVSTIALVLLIPVMIIVGILSYISTGGSPFYCQERTGKGGKRFNIYKFRTMPSGSEPDGPVLSDESDSRPTRIGRILRRYRLDELPQFWNVLKGDMSIVGPRPERQYFIDRIVEKAPYYPSFLELRPGITSLGMVKYGYASTVDQMVERSVFDLDYYQNRSLGLDIKIMLWSIPAIISGKGK